jgi:hypothetical protein
MIDALQDNVSRLIAGRTESRVGTTTLLPSGALASIVVRPSGNGTFLVTDGGAALNDLLALGHHDFTTGDRRRGNTIADRLGLTFDGAGFSLREVTADQLAGAIVFVAEGAREWATATAEIGIKRQEAALVRRVEDRIRAIVPGAKIDRERELAGASTKTHRFDLVIDLSGDRKVVFEAVSPSPNSLSSTHLKLFDLMSAHPEWPREVVTERLEDWSVADMTLLAGVSTHVRPMNREWRDLPDVVH